MFYVSDSSKPSTKVKRVKLYLRFLRFYVFSKSKKTSLFTFFGLLHTFFSNTAKYQSVSVEELLKYHIVDQVRRHLVNHNDHPPMNLTD